MGEKVALVIEHHGRGQGALALKSLVLKVTAELEKLDEIVAKLSAEARVLFFASIEPRYSRLRYCFECGSKLDFEESQADLHECKKPGPPAALAAKLMDELAKGGE